MSLYQIDFGLLGEQFGYFLIFGCFVGCLLAYSFLSVLELLIPLLTSMVSRFFKRH